MEQNTILGLQGPKSSIVLSDLIKYSNQLKPLNRKEFILSRPPILFRLSLFQSSLIENDVASQKGNIPSSLTSSNISSSAHSNLLPQSYYPYMSSFQLLFEHEDLTVPTPSLPLRQRSTIITCLRIGTTGEDGFEFIIDKSSVLPFAT